jgi:hypothetical protein
MDGQDYEGGSTGYGDWSCLCGPRTHFFRLFDLLWFLHDYI